MVLTDQLLSDNIDPKALTAVGAPATNDQGQPLGTLVRLEIFLSARSTGDVSGSFKVLRAVRNGRNRPAHKSQAAVTDHTLVVRQRDILLDIGLALSDIRKLLATHPAATKAKWEPPEDIDRWMLL